VVQHLSEELQIHRDLLTIQRDDRAREIDELRRDVERQREQLTHNEQTIDQLRAVIDDLLLHQTHPGDGVLHLSTTTAPTFPTGMFAAST